MPINVDFDVVHFYDAGKDGISVPVGLRTIHKTVSFEAKIDTGSSYTVRGSGFSQSLFFQQ